MEIKAIFWETGWQSDQNSSQSSLKCAFLLEFEFDICMDHKKLQLQYFVKYSNDLEKHEIRLVSDFFTQFDCAFYHLYNTSTWKDAKMDFKLLKNCNAFLSFPFPVCKIFKIWYSNKLLKYYILSYIHQFYTQGIYLFYMNYIVK